ncbi:MAG: penicillin-insensitive murein endopeptidase [Bdellovibrionales bacterium]|nr:penicillin-insensitive murein endopeptidase [Bdellovibrionales bacterium]
MNWRMKFFYFLGGTLFLSIGACTPKKTKTKLDEMRPGDSPALFGQENAKKGDEEDVNLSGSVVLYPALSEDSERGVGRIDGTTNLSDTLRFVKPSIFFDKRNRDIELRVTIESEGEKIPLVLRGRVGAQGRADLEETQTTDVGSRLRAIAQCIDLTMCQSIYVDVYYRENGVNRRKQFISDESDNEMQFDPPKVIPNDQKVKSEKLEVGHTDQTPIVSVCDDHTGCAGEFVGYKVDSKFYEEVRDLGKPKEREPPSEKPLPPEKVPVIKGRDETGSKSGNSAKKTLDEIEVIGEAPKVSKSERSRPDQTTPDLSLSPKGNQSAVGDSDLVEVDSRQKSESTNFSDKTEGTTISGESETLIEKEVSSQAMTGTLIEESDLKLGAQSKGLPYFVCFSRCGTSRCLKQTCSKKDRRLVGGSISESGSGPNFLDEAEKGEFEVIDLKREQHYGSGLLVATIKKASLRFQEKYGNKDLIRVNALSKKGGGALGGHSSHQNGLDADIVYMGESKWGTVLDKMGEVKKDFDIEKNYQFFKMLVATGYVNRIFVDQKIKKSMCGWVKSQGLMDEAKDVLTALRAYSGHDDHFHLRLKCSPYYPLCRDQTLPNGTECS